MGIPVSFTEPITAEQEAVLWFIRMPRLIIGLLVGGALAIAGAVMQGVFSNPLADPGIAMYRELIGAPYRDHYDSYWRGRPKYFEWYGHTCEFYGAYYG